MKLAKIQHDRCGEINAYTYVWVPEELTLAEFEEMVREAQAAYLAFVESFNDMAAPTKLWGTVPGREWWNEHLDLTVEEALTEWTMAKDEYDTWHAQRELAKRTFADYLLEHGCKRYWQYDPELTVDCQWGHRHGLALRYDDPEPAVDELPGPVSRQYDDGFGS